MNIVVFTDETHILYHTSGTVQEWLLAFWKLVTIDTSLAKISSNILFTSLCCVNFRHKFLCLHETHSHCVSFSKQ